METLPFLLGALLTVCLMPSALALKCYECANIPGYTGGQCNGENVNSITCNDLLDRCMTITATATVPGSGEMSFELKNCSSSILCKPGSTYNMCNILNVTTAGAMSKCTTDCCEGDQCNGAIRISGVLASFVAILLTVVLNLFPGFY